MLVCPLTKAVLVYSAEKQELLSRKAALAYPIRNGVPLMTAEAARHLTDEEIDKVASGIVAAVAKATGGTLRT